MPRAALFSLAVVVAAVPLLGGTGAAIAQEKVGVGVSSAVNPAATGAPPGQGAKPLVIGQDVVFNEHIATTEGGQTQLLFVDESSMTVGPNSDLTIDQFVHDPKRRRQARAAASTISNFDGSILSRQAGATI